MAQYMYFRRAGLEEANFQFFLIHISQSSIEYHQRDEQTSKTATNKKRGAYNKISPVNLITHDIYIF